MHWPMVHRGSRRFRLLQHRHHRPAGLRPTAARFAGRRTNSRPIRVPLSASKSIPSSAAHCPSACSTSWRGVASSIRGQHGGPSESLPRSGRESMPLSCGRFCNRPDWFQGRGIDPRIWSGFETSRRSAGRPALALAVGCDCSRVSDTDIIAHDNNAYRILDETRPIESC